MNRTNYIFVDFENVHETEWERIIGKQVQAIIVLGPQHKFMPIAEVKALLRCASQIRLIETKKAGRNAADLLLAQHIGEQRKEDPQGYFHVVSKDKGFDSLISNLRDNGTMAARRESLSDIPVLMNGEERILAFAAYLKANPENRPVRRKALEAQIQHNFAKTLVADEIGQLIAALESRGVLKIDASGKVAYLG